MEAVVSACQIFNYNISSASCKQLPILQIISGVELSFTNNPRNMTAGALVKRVVRKSWLKYTYSAALDGNVFLDKKKVLHLFYFIFCLHIGGGQVWFAINCQFIKIEGKKVQLKPLGYHRQMSHFDFFSLSYLNMSSLFWTTCEDLLSLNLNKF